MIQAETQAQGAEGFTSKAPCKEPQSTGTDYRKGHIYKHSKTLLVHENGTKEGWAHKIDTGRDADAKGPTKYSNDSCVTDGTSEGLS